MKEYDHKTIEKKWQEKWAEEKIYEADESSEKPKSYILDMFPYPSGEGLHVGHIENYTATDILARYRRMQGDNVLHPIGWDSFGLPAENFAIKNKVHPRERTEESIANFMRQLKSIGVSFDWSRELGTHRPDYYKWTQWFFLFLYKNALASRKNAKVNWCESCQTVLANEQVENGRCERCKNEVIQKDLKQWFFHITKYADELVSGLDDVDWPQSTKINQRNWIGRSEGSEISFPIAKKFHYVILHGYDSSPKRCFHPWLEKELGARGHTVETLKLPNSGNPDVMEQVQYVLENTTFDENTILIGHSLGCTVAMKALEISGKKIHKLILFSGFMLDTDEKRIQKYVKTNAFTCDYKKVRESARSISYIYDENDTFVDEVMAAKTANMLDVPLIRVSAEKTHFTGKTEPEVLKHALPQIDVFTTRADTLFGATYMVLAPEHELVDSLKNDISNWEEVKKYRDEASKKTELERTSEGKKKTGVEIKGVKATNPANSEEIPIYVADYVLSGYGTGAIMAVPAHDERDEAFAKAFDIPVRMVVRPQDDEGNEEGLFTGDGTLENSGNFSGMESEKARKAITEYVGGEMKTTYKLRDWLVSRQRYWGAPIPIIYCEKCGEVPVPEKDLPVLLPDDVDFMPTGESPLVKSKAFHDVKCPACGVKARRESDTMDTFVDSSWYYYRFADSHNDKEFASSEQVKKWLPVDMYVGGAEHTVLHLMYARFFTKVLADYGYVDFREPFQKLRHQGMIMAEDGRKMSKSLGNVVNPDGVIEIYGADTLRMYEMFMGPLHEAKPWSSQNIIGVRRFIEKVWRISEKVGGSENNTLLEKEVHKTVKKVTEDIEGLAFNTAISQMMICANTMEKSKSIPHDVWSMFLRVLAPFAPHVTEELWETSGESESIHLSTWPTHDPEKVQDDEVNLAVQVNGKVRGTVVLAVDEEESEAVEKALKVSQIAKYVHGDNVKKTIYKPGRILNFVLKDV